MIKNNMPKAILEFDLNDPDESEYFRQISKSADMACVLVTLRDRFREIEKYGKPPISREEFIALLFEYSINLDDICS